MICLFVKQNIFFLDVTEFESTPEGRRINKLDQIFLNGNHVTSKLIIVQFISQFFTRKIVAKSKHQFILAVLVPGGAGPDM